MTEQERKKKEEEERRRRTAPSYFMDTVLPAIDYGSSSYEPPPSVPAEAPCDSGSSFDSGGGGFDGGSCGGGD